jgi:hypothetical protein
MARYFCNSGFCDRTEGFAFEEIETYFVRDRTLVCCKCKERQRAIDAAQALRYGTLRVERERIAGERHAALLEQLAQARARQIDDVMAALGEPNLVLERLSKWQRGPQHLGGPFYRCATSACNQPCRDPDDFSFIYRAGKTPLFDGDTVCDDCFAVRFGRFSMSTTM